ncbi:MAG: RNA polymerase sigma factor [Planctomycetota bacterium]|jgi:RNA polymerase sigma-70 factor (ECF subfamily)
MKPREQTETLVLRCQIGDKDAFEELFEQFQPRLRYYVRRLDQTGTNTEDILQEVWLTVLRKISKLKEAKSFRTWLYKIARNTVYGRFRKKHHFAPLNEAELSLQIDPDEEELPRYGAEKIHEALNNIQVQHREVLTLFFLERMPYQAIAEVVGCNIGTVKSRIHYAKQSLRKALESRNE